MSFRSKFILINALFLCIFACCTSKEEKRESAFAAKLKRHNLRELPLEIRPCGMNSSGLQELDPDSAGADGFIPYFTFKTNGDYYALISLGIADCSMPLLSTFDGDGNKIDEKILSISGCNSGPGFICSEYVKIEKDFSIFTCDSVAEMDLENEGHESGKVKARYIRYRQGKLQPDGKIELSAEQRKELRVE